MVHWNCLQIALKSLTSTQKFHLFINIYLMKMRITYCLPVKMQSVAKIWRCPTGYHLQHPLSVFLGSALNSIMTGGKCLGLTFLEHLKGSKPIWNQVLSALLLTEQHLNVFLQVIFKHLRGHTADRRTDLLVSAGAARWHWPPLADIQAASSWGTISLWLEAATELVCGL